MEQKETGRLIAQRRKEKQLTQQQLADRLHVTNKAVSKWERGHSLPDVGILPQLAAILDLTIDELLSGKKTAVQAATPPQSAPYVSPGVIRRQMEEQRRKHSHGVVAQVGGWLIIAAQLIGSLRTGLVYLIGSDELLSSLTEGELIALGVPDWKTVFPWIFTFRLNGMRSWKLRSIWALWLSYPLTFVVFLAAVALIVWGVRRCRRFR